MSAEQDAITKLARLSTKQREVLDLLVELKETKEISLILDIKPETVHQRFSAAREKIGVLGTRNQVLQSYIRLRVQAGEIDAANANARMLAEGIYDQVIYDPVTVALEDELPETSPQVLEAGAVFRLSDVGTAHVPGSETDLPLTIKGLEALDQRLGIGGRLVVIAILAAALLLVGVAALSIGRTLSEIF